MGRNIDLGVFLPITNNGWIISKNSPQFLPTFDLNREICQLAERADFSYVFSMAKWRGFGGEVEFWKHSIDSLILMTGLASAVPTLRLIASISPALIHPAIFAKISASMDDVSHGRVGINIVSAANKGEYTQMGMWPENFESYRYEYNDEWITVVKRLWAEDSVTHNGKFFQLDDCISFPKPLNRGMPVVCATSSERGFRFVAEHCTDGFFGVESLDAQKTMSRRVKEVAAEHQRTVRTHTLLMVILGDSDEDAQRTLKHYEAGADLQAIENIYKLRSREKTGPRFERLQRRFESDLRLFYDGVPFVGGPERVADRIEELAVEGDLDGFLLIFADFVEGLKRFDQQVVPLLRKRGIGRLTPPFAPPPTQMRASM